MAGPFFSLHSTSLAKPRTFLSVRTQNSRFFNRLAIAAELPVTRWSLGFQPPPRWLRRLGGMVLSSISLGHPLTSATWYSSSFSSTARNWSRSRINFLSLILFTSQNFLAVSWLPWFVVGLKSFERADFCLSWLKHLILTILTYIAFLLLSVYNRNVGEISIFNTLSWIFLTSLREHSPHAALLVCGMAAKD